MSRPKKKGFTLVELVVVLVIMTVILGIAIPSVLHYMKMAEFRKNEENAKTVYLAAESKLTYYRSSGQWEETIELHGQNRSVLIKMPDSVTITDEKAHHAIEMTPLAMGWAKSEDNLGFSYAIRHFLDCVRDNKQPLTSAQDAFKTHELLDRVLKSAGLPAMD